MKKWMVFGVSFGFFIFFASLVCAVRINEVMANTPSNVYGDSKCEWIEIYSDSQKNLSNWILNTPGHNLTLDCYINDFLIITGNKTCFKNNWPEVNDGKVIEWSAASLNDNGDNVSLFNDSGVLVNFVEYPSLSANKTYLLLSNSSWIICDKPTPGSVNSCESQTPDNNDEAEIYLDASWEEEEIINGEEFEIEMDSYNLKYDKYNLKIWIEFEENDTVISERYDEGNDEWKSGTYYIDEFFEGEGNKTETVKVRIRSAYKNFHGEALLKAKLESEDYTLEKEITILEKEEENTNKNGTEAEKEDENEKNETKKTTAQPTEGVIKLGNRSKLQQNDTKAESKIVYESGNEKVKKYAIYALNIVLIAIIILLIKKKV